MHYNKVVICGINTADIKVLTKTEKKELMQKIKQGDKQAQNEFINGNLRLVLSVVKRFSDRGEDADDLFQVGCIGLIKAINNFDVEQGVQFSTYAVPTNVLGRNEEIMRPRKWTESAIQQAFDNFTKRHNRLPTKQEMYEKYKGEFPRPLSVKLTLGITLDKYLLTNYAIYYKRKRARIYGVQEGDYWIEDFKNQYIKFGCPTEKLYNKLRNPHTPNTETLAKIIGVKTWNGVLEHCGLIKKEKTELDSELVFVESLENYEMLNNKLQNFVKNF